MKRFVLVTALLTVALALVACSAPASDSVTTEPPQTRSTESTLSVDGLIYSLSVPSATLDTSSTSAVTYSVTNSTEATLTFSGPVRLVVNDDSGEVVLDTLPPSQRRPRVLVELGPASTFRKSVAFEVPGPGTCTALLPEVVDSATGEPLTVEFESVKR